MSKPTSLDSAILARQTALLYRNAGLGQAVTVVSASILAYAAVQYVSAGSVLVWWLATMLVAAGRYALARRFAALPEADSDAQRWSRTYSTGTALSGVVWGCGAVLFSWNAPDALRFFTALVLAGMVAGAVPILASVARSFRNYAIPMVGPVAAVAFLQATSPLHWALGFAALLFLFGVLRSATYLNQTLIESIRLGLEMRELAVNLEHARAAAEAASRAKSQFLANMGHEVRTPMNAVLGMSELLTMTDLDADQQGYLAEVRNAGQQLMGLIDDILDYARIEAGEVKLEQTAFAFAEIVAMATRPCVADAACKGIAFAQVIDPAVPQEVIGDPARLRQIIGHVLGNAVKFTESGSIDLHVGLANSQSDSALIEFVVRDTGIGIPADKLDAIFEAFTQADGSTTRKHGGTGIGLAICRALTHEMHGDIAVESVPDRGTVCRFSVEFGLPKAAQV